MAERLSDTFKKEFDNQLTCNVCLGQYTNPKILPCHHSFCLTCIEPIPVEIKDGKYSISCPTCRANHFLPQGGVKDLPSDFKVNKLLDLRRRLATIKKGTCPQHIDNPLKFYCETCCKVICQDCTVSMEHNRHTFYLVSDCYSKLQENLGNIGHLLHVLNKAVTCLTTKEHEVQRQGQEVKERINEYARQLIDCITQSQTHLTQQVDTIVQQKKRTIATQKQQAQKIHSQLKACQGTIEHNLKEWTQQQILTQKHAMMDEMNTATQHVDPKVFQPIENADIEFNKTKNEIKLGFVTGKSYGKATLVTSPSLPLPKRQSTATLTLQALDGSPFSLPVFLISAAHSSPSEWNKGVIKCPVSQAEPGKYDITFTPTIGKNQQMLVQVGGVDVPGSPFSLSVMPTSPKPSRFELHTKITGLVKPHGMAICDNGNLMVVEWGHCVKELNDEGHLVRFIGRQGRQLNYARGIALTNGGHVLVTDNHRLLELTDGVCVQSIGDKQSGSGQLQFKYPNGIAVHPTNGQIFVADSENDRIQVFNHDFTFFKTIVPGFNNPQDVALDGKGNLYVAEWSSHCITKTSSRGEIIKRIGSLGSAPGQLSRPTALTIYNNLVYVADSGNNRVSIFDTSGKFLYNISCNCPRGITTDTRGNLYVSDHERNIFIFKRNSY